MKDSDIEKKLFLFFLVGYDVKGIFSNSVITYIGNPTKEKYVNMHT